MGVAKSISKFLILVLIIFLVVFSMVNILPFILKTQHPIEMIQGISMENTYFDGDLVVLGGVPTQDIQVGDVVGYQRSSGSLIIHRVIAIITINDDVLFTTKGDNPVSNPFPDSQVTSLSIVGKVLFHIPAWLGRVIYPVVITLQNPLSLVLAVALIAIIVLLSKFVL